MAQLFWLRESCLVIGESFKLLNLLIDTAAETMKYGTNSAHKGENAPEQGSAQYMGQSGLGVRKQQYTPGDKIGSSDNTGVTEDQGGDTAPVEGQINQGGADNNRHDPGGALRRNNGKDSQNNKNDSKGGGDFSGGHKFTPPENLNKWQFLNASGMLLNLIYAGIMLMFPKMAFRNLG